ncbi:MAG: hypothetical protein ACFE0O_07000, partial [Opitutales bacterium]
PSPGRQPGGSPPAEAGAPAGFEARPTSRRPTDPRRRGEPGGPAEARLQPGKAQPWPPARRITTG